MTTSPADTATCRRAAVYRLYDAAGTLLYIGSAYYPNERAKAHRHATWGCLIARRIDEWHDSRELAYTAEAEAIRSEDPQHNVMGTANHTGPKERGRALSEAASVRWRAARKTRNAGGSEDESRRAGALAEIEYLEGTGMFAGYVARMRSRLNKGATYTHWSIRID